MFLVRAKIVENFLRNLEGCVRFYFSDNIKRCDAFSCLSTDSRRPHKENTEHSRYTEKEFLHRFYYTEYLSQIKRERECYLALFL